MLGTVVSQGGAVLASPLVARIYGPSVLGEYFVYTALLYFVSTWASLRYEFAIPLVDDDRTANAAYSLAVINGVSIVLLLIGAVALLGVDQTASTLGVSGRSVILYAAALGIVCENARAAGRVAAIRKRAYRPIAWNTAAQALSFVLLQLIGGLVAPTLLTLLMADVASRLASALHFYGFGRLGSTRDNRWSAIWYVAKRYRRFATMTTPATALNGLSLQMPLILLSGRYGAVVGGYFGLVQRIAGAPAAVVGRALSEAFYGRAAAARRGNPEQIGPLFRRTLVAGGIVAVIVVAPALLITSFAVAPLFGDDWAEAGLYLRILTPMFAMQIVNVGVDPILSVIERQDLHLVREVLRAGVTLLPLFVTIALFRPATVAVAALAAGGTVAYIAYLLLGWMAVRTHSRSSTLAPDQGSPHLEGYA